MKHTIEQVALAHKRDNQNNYKHHFFRCCIATDWALVLGSLHCNHLSLLWHSFFRGLFFVFIHFLIFIRKCTPFVLFSYLDRDYFMGLVARRQQNLALMWMCHFGIKRGIYHCSSGIVWFVLFEWKRICLWREKKEKMNTNDKFKQGNFIWIKVSRIMTK